jgi:predicted dehydrogenase
VSHSAFDPPDAVVLGCGSIGSRHIANLLALGARVVAFDPDPMRREDVAGAPGVRLADTLDEALGCGGSFAVVSAPTSTHVELARAAAERGLAVFIEKPLSHTWDGVDSLLGLIAARELVSMVGCNLRFHPTLLRAKELLSGGAIGAPLSARAEFGHYLPDWHPDQDYRRSYSALRARGGGIVLDAIHELDYISWMLGPVKEVACRAGHVSSLEIETEDVAAIVLDFGGPVAEVHLDYLQRDYSRTLQLIGSEGTIRWDFVTGELRWYSASSGRWEAQSSPAGWNLNDMYVDEMRHFLGCVRRRMPSQLDVAGGAEVLRVALAALRSSEDGRFVGPDEIGSAGSRTSAAGEAAGAS